jgi:hypothetical protein
MVKEDNKQSQIIEHGDVFFFYRPKVGTEEVEDIEDVQRFYMITSPEDGGGRKISTCFAILLMYGYESVYVFFCV